MGSFEAACIDGCTKVHGDREKVSLHSSPHNISNYLLQLHTNILPFTLTLSQKINQIINWFNNKILKAMRKTKL